jgi:hypothetical protein
MMPDWERIVRRELDGLVLGQEERGEVVAELAAHLEEACEAMLRQGVVEEEAMRRTLLQAGDWRDLRMRIQKTRSKEDVMTNRVRQFWLPGILTFVLSEGSLALFQKFGPKPWIFAWGQPGPPVAMFYIPWLLLLPFIGAVGAYFSYRAGGSQRVVFSSTVFPVLAFLGLFSVALPVNLIIHNDFGHNIMASAFLMVMLAWVLVPGAALLAGGLPVQLFLSRRLASRSVASH